MKRYLGFLLLLPIFCASCNLAGDAGTCEENNTEYVAPHDPDDDGGGWGHYYDQCEDN